MAKTFGKYRWAWARLQEGKTVYYVQESIGVDAFKVRQGGVWWKRKKFMDCTGRRSPWRRCMDNEHPDWNVKFQRYGNPTFHLTEAEAKK